MTEHDREADGDEMVRLALAEIQADGPEPQPFEALPWEAVMSQHRSTTRRNLLVAIAVLVAAVGTVAILFSSGDETQQIPSVSSDPTEPEPESSEPTSDGEPIISADRVPPDPYLPSWTPEGFELTAVRWLDVPPEIQPPEPTEIDGLILGDSETVSDVSVRMTARRFQEGGDLEDARYIEDALMVQGGGPTTGLAIGETIFAYHELPGSDGTTEFAQFHGTIDDVLITGFVFGQLDPSRLARLLASVSIPGGDLRVEIDAAAADLLPLHQGTPPSGPADQYWLEYSNGTDAFSAVFHAGAPEATITAGSLSRDGDRTEGEHGSGFVEAQPEVGGAIGSRRLFWWVPAVAVQVWYGDILSDADATRFADSVVPVSVEEWETATGEVKVELEDMGPLNLPEDPQQTLTDRLEERERIAIGADQPEIDVADIAAFVGEQRGGELPAAADVAWVGPLEADRLTSGASFLPPQTWHVLVALGLVDPDEERETWSEARRVDVRGMCCNGNEVTLVEGLGPDEAAVVFAHELTHLYDIEIVGVDFGAQNEVMPVSSALLEGNATRIMRAYRDSQGIEMDLGNRPYDNLDIPVAVQRIFRFAYLDGEAFANELAASGGEAAVDRALRDTPPRSTEHILHPDRYLAGDQPEPVDAPEPPAGATVEARSTLGAFMVALAAEDALGWTEAVELSAAWAGDGYVAWSEGEQRCLSARILFDDQQAAASFAAAAEADQDGSSVDLRRCN